MRFPPAGSALARGAATSLACLALTGCQIFDEIEKGTYDLVLNADSTLDFSMSMSGALDPDLLDQLDEVEALVQRAALSTFGDDLVSVTFRPEPAEAALFAVEARYSTHSLEGPDNLDDLWFGRIENGGWEIFINQTEAFEQGDFSIVYDYPRELCITVHGAWSFELPDAEHFPPLVLGERVCKTWDANTYRELFWIKVNPA